MPYSKEEEYEPVAIQGCKGIVVSKNGKNLLCSCDSWDKDEWIARSVIHDDSEVYKEGTKGTLILPRWYANKLGLK